MRKLFFALFALITLSAQSQTFIPINNYQAPNGIAATKYLAIPVGTDTTLNGLTDTIQLTNGTRIKAPALFFQTRDTTLYIHFGKWMPLRGGSGGSSVRDTIGVLDDLYVTFDSTGKQYLGHYHADGLISGGIVSGTGGLGIAVTSPTYYLNHGTKYIAPAINLTAHVDGTFARKDIVIADTLGVVSLLEGVPAANPIEPTVNPASQLRLVEFDVPANATNLFTIKYIYREGTEWDTATSGTITANFRDTQVPFNGTHDILVSSYTDGSQFIFTDSGPDTITSTSIIKLYGYLRTVLKGQISAQLFNGTTPVSSLVAITPYINSVDTTEYQNITFLGSILNVTAPFNKIKFTYAGNDISGVGGMFWDDIQLQSGIQNSFPSSDWTVTIRNDSVFQNRNGSIVFVGTVITSGGGTTTNPLTMNNSGSGAASGSTFDGSLAKTISWNTILDTLLFHTVNYYNVHYQAVGNYITALTGDGTASGPGSAALTLATVNSNIGTWNNVTVNGKGLVTAGSNVSYLTSIDTTNIPNFSVKVRSLFNATSPIIYNNGNFKFDTTIIHTSAYNDGRYLQSNQAITVTATGDATGTSSSSGTAPSLPLTLATVNSNVGSFTNANITVNAKGLVTAASNGSGGSTEQDTVNFNRVLVTNAPYTASIKDYAAVSATTGNVTVTLPNAPQNKSRVLIKAISLTAGDTVKYTTQGSDTLNKSGGAITGYIVLLNQAVQLMYSSSTKIWTIISDDVPVGQLDTRYGLNAVTAIDSTTTHAISSTQKFKTIDSLSGANLYAGNGMVAGDSIVIQTDSVWFWGNSIEQGQQASVQANRYTTLASGKLKTVEVNKGIGGSTLQRTSVGDSSFIDRLYSVPNWRTGIRYIVIGSYAQNDMNLNKGYSTYITALQNAIDTLIINRGYPARRIIVITPSLGWNATIGKTVDSMALFANGTIAVAKAKGVILIDVFHYMLNNGGRSALIGADSAHPNDAGYSAIANAIDIGTGSQHLYGSQYVGRDEVVNGRLGVATNEFSDAVNALGQFKIKQGSTYLNFNGSQSFAALNIGIDNTNYLRVIQNGTSGTIFNQVGANSLSLQTATTNRYVFAGNGDHTVTAANWNLTSTGNQALTLTGGWTATSAASTGAYSFLEGTATHLLRFKIGNTTTKNLIISQDGTSVDVTDGRQGDIVFRAFSSDSTIDMFLGATSSFTPSIIIHSRGHGVTIGDDTTNTALLSSMFTVSTRAGSPIKASIPYPRMTTTSRNTITAVEGEGIYNTTLHAKEFYNNSQWVSFGLGQISGTATNDNATAGNIGENLSGAGQSSYTNYTTSATYQPIDSITLTAGDWDLTANYTISANSATLTTTSNAIFAISTTTASATGTTEGLGDITYIDENLLGNSKQSGVIHIRKSVSGSTKIYLNSQTTFTVGNPQYVCSMRARRMR